MIKLKKKYKIYLIKYSTGIETMIYTKHKSFLDRFKKHLSENITIDYFKIDETDNIEIAVNKYQAEPLPL